MGQMNLLENELTSKTDVLSVRIILVFSYYWSLWLLQSEKEQHVNTKQQLENKLTNEMKLTEEVCIY